MAISNYTTNITKPSLLLLSMLMLFPLACMDNAKDREECKDSLLGLAPCLPYVDGEAKAPTPDCCSGLKQVLKTKKKCLCVIVRDRNDPDLSLSINVTLALGLPQVCNAPANVSQCPDLLNLPPNSPEAQVFYQFGKQPKSVNATAPTPSHPLTVPVAAPGNSGVVEKWPRVEFIALGLLFVILSQNCLFVR